NMACPLYRLIQHQEKPQTVKRGATELARTLLPPSENPHFMRVSGITCHCNGATSVKVAPYRRGLDRVRCPQTCDEGPLKRKEEEGRFGPPLEQVPHRR